MTSVDYFEKWGRAPVENIFSDFDGGIIHIHANGRHLLPAVASLKGLKAIYLNDDKGYPPSFKVLHDIKKQTGDIPLIVSVDYNSFKKALDSVQLLGGVLYNVTGTPNINCANKLIDKVRNYYISKCVS
jgi:hypothetical protein